MYRLKDKTHIGAEEPITLEKVLEYLHNPPAEMHSILSDFITAARERCEEVTNRSLVAHTLEVEADIDSGEITLVYTPIDEVTKVERFRGGEWEELSDSEYTLLANYLVISNGLTRISYTTSPYISENLNRLQLELIQAWFDNRPDVEQVQELIENRMKKYTVWLTE